jgi:hypothetical protein
LLVPCADLSFARKILLLCPLFFTSWFYGSYIGTLQTQYMNVRTRSLCAFVIPFGDIAGGFMIGYFLDTKRLTIKQRARWSFVALMVLNLALWIWTAVVTKQLEDKQPVIDWTSGSIFASTFILFILFDLATMATQTSLYWIISQMSDDFIALSYMTGTLRGVECAGQAVAYGIKSTDSSNWISIGLNVGLSACPSSIVHPVTYSGFLAQSCSPCRSRGWWSARLASCRSRRSPTRLKPTLGRTLRAYLMRK